MVSSHPLTELLQRGRWGEVRAVVCADGKNHVRDFLFNDLEKIKISKFPLTTARHKCMAWFLQLADNGTLTVKRFHAEAAGFMGCCFEIKNKLVRFPCFRDGNAWILTHGFFKPGAQKGLGKWPKEEVDRAERLRAEYTQRKALLQR